MRRSVTWMPGGGFVLSVIALFYIVCVTSGIISDQVARFAPLDSAASSFLAPYRHQYLIQIFLWITTLGAGPTLFIVVLVSSALLATTGRRAMIFPLWLAYGGVEATVWATKYAVGRARPEFISAATAVSPSFPSGHTAGSIALYGFLAYVIALGLGDTRLRVAAVLFVTALVAAISFSRVFLGVHFFTDVVAGLFIGAYWLLAGILWNRRRSAV